MIRKSNNYYYIIYCRVALGLKEAVGMYKYMYALLHVHKVCLGQTKVLQNIYKPLLKLK